MNNVTVTPYFVEGDRYPSLIGVKAEGDEYELAYVSKQELIEMDERHRNEVAGLREECDKLREFVTDLRDVLVQDGETDRGWVLDRMRELGVEVD